MASPFQKYQGEQVQQIPAGYVEAMGSMGKAYASIGQSIAGGLQEADKKATEEAKLQGSLAPYIKNDKRIQTVDGMIRSGTLVKNEDGTVAVNPIYEGVWDASKAKPIMDFYNQTGGDGSKLTGTALTKFATEFEAQQKYDAAQAAKADKEIERQKTLAEINKLNAEAAEKAGNAAANAVVAGFGAGIPAGTSPSPVFAPGVQPQQAGQPQPQQIVTANAFGKISLSDINTSPGLDVSRYNIGMKLSNDLNAAPVEAPAPVAPAVAPAKAPAPAVAPDLPSTNVAIPQVVAATEALRVEYSTQYKTDSDNLAAELSARMIELGRTGGATPDRVRLLNETFKIRKDNLDKAYADRVSLLDARVKAVTEVTKERRDMQTEAFAMQKEKREEAEDQRKVETHQMTIEEFNAKWGGKIVLGQQTGTVPSGAAAKPGTFANFQYTKVERAGAIPGRTGGTESEKLKEEAYGVFQKRKSEYPAAWGIGVFHAGAKEFQLDLNYRPTASPIDPAVRGKVSENIEGYAEAQSYLTQLNDVVNSTDDNKITNFLNRSLWTATTEAKKTVVTGDMMNQFGVAAFRRAIVSGGNFSDADREYVAKLITDINSAHVMKDKALLLAQTKALATFIDQKYRSTLAGKDIRFDIDTAKKFLTREEDTAGLAQLKKTEQYVNAFGINTKDSSEPVVPEVDLPSKFEELAKRFEAAGGAEGRKQAEVYRKKAAEVRSKYEEAARQAQANVERTR
jgi:hypothetical protein